MSRIDCSRLSAGYLSSKSQDFAPSGISSLDSILNSGFPVGSLVLLEEDELQVYSRLFVKYFLAEGVARKDYLYVASKEIEPETIIGDLPVAIASKEDVIEVPSDELKIAWRYQNNSVVQSSPNSRRSFSHDFDFKTKLSDKDLNIIDYTIWPRDPNHNSNESMINDIHSVISSKGLWNGQESKNPLKKILRLTVPSLGSPLWPVDVPLVQTLFKLRTLVHNSSSVSIVTLPVQLLDDITIHRCEQVSDIVIKLNSLANNINPQFSEYNGLLTLLKISPINSLSIQTPEDGDWAFKANKRKLTIEKLHLPPESSITAQREQDDLANGRKPACQLEF